MTLAVVILAAGQGKRMASALPKVLHPIGGRPMLAHVMDTARELEAAALHVVVGHGSERVVAAFAATPDLVWVEQRQQLGTGHAVAQALPGLPETGSVLVLYGDVPLVRAETLRALVDHAAAGRVGLLSVRLPDPAGYGRILRDAAGRVTGIVEHKDASPAQRAVDEVNTGILALPAARLRGWLEALGNDNAQGEYYLTDVIAMAVADGVEVSTELAQDAAEVQGVNDRVQLAALEREYQLAEARRLMLAGATLADPARLDVRGRVHCGRDVSIDVGVILEGEVRLGDGVRIGPYSVIRDAVIEAGATVLGHSTVEGAHLGPATQVGPYARLRPGTVLAAGSRVGNFVEIKNSSLGPGAKANHLAYLGDAEVGADANVGAGTITCNYDGAAKHRTVIGEGAFIGSNSALVAPVAIGAHATVGAGSTITREVPTGALAVARAAQRLIAGWQRPRKPR